MKLKDFFFKSKVNPLDERLEEEKKLGHTKFLILWNRGLGDIPLGLYALILRIREKIPHATITFLTREDLKDVFFMIPDIQVIATSQLKRGQNPNITQMLLELGYHDKDFDCILERIDGDKWLKWQIGTITPRLSWKEEWDHLVDKFSLKADEKYIGVHLSSETGQFYGYEKNWPIESFETLFQTLQMTSSAKVLLFGFSQEPVFELDHVIDLRGKTSLFEMLSILKNRCTHFIGPDSGVLSVLYYIDAEFPLRVVSLWADPRQGILKQKVHSPNLKLEHIPLLGTKEKVSNISVEDVIEALKLTV